MLDQATYSATCPNEEKVLILAPQQCPKRCSEQRHIFAQVHLPTERQVHVHGQDNEAALPRHRNVVCGWAVLLVCLRSGRRRTASTYVGYISPLSKTVPKCILFLILDCRNRTSQVGCPQKGQNPRLGDDAVLLLQKRHHHGLHERYTQLRYHSSAQAPTRMLWPSWPPDAPPDHHSLARSLACQRPEAT